jgi:hypothetical protein
VPGCSFSKESGGHNEELKWRLEKGEQTDRQIERKAQVTRSDEKEDWTHKAPRAGKGEPGSMGRLSKLIHT